MKITGKGFKRGVISEERKRRDSAVDANYQSPYASDPSSTSWRVAHGLSPLINAPGITQPSDEALAEADRGGGVSLPAGAHSRAFAAPAQSRAAGESANPQMLAAVLRRMGGAGGGPSGQGGFSFGQQTDMNSLPGASGTMGAQGRAVPGGMQQAPWQGLNRQMYLPTAGGGASGFSGGGGQMWAGGSPTFDEGAGGRFIGGGGLPGAAAGGMSPGMGAVPRTAGGMSFAPDAGATGQQQADPWADFLSQYSQQ
jgi:hypothetical protein